MSIAPDAMLMMRPDPCSIMTRPADWHPKNTPLKFTARTRSRSASSVSTTMLSMDDPGDVDHHVEPAVCGDGAEDEVFHVGTRATSSVAPDRGGLAAVGDDLVGGLGRRARR